MPTILDKIVADKRKQIDLAKARRSETELLGALDSAPPVRSFFDTLSGDTEAVSLIAEIKKASPSQGLIRDIFDPVRIANIYRTFGARCISVLTDEPYFQGSLDHLTQVRQVVDIPLLRKDFIVDSYQVLEARVAGADAVLLIAECLDDCHLRKLHNEIIDLGMTPLVEFYEPDNLPRVLEAGATLVGVNNRDLKTMKVDIEHTLRMRDKIPEHCLLVAESGIETREDVSRLRDAGVDAMLVGTSLMKCDDLGTAVAALIS